MMEAPTPFEILKSLDLLSWTALSVGWERGWVTNTNVDEYATIQLQSDVSDVDLAAMATLASADQLDTREIAELLKQLAGREAEQDLITLDKWRLARLLELQATQLDWDEKVIRLEELAAEFGYPPDMRLCSRYVGSEEIHAPGPLDAMEDLISELKQRLGVG
jgi:hypothetical protein